MISIKKLSIDSSFIENRIREFIIRKIEKANLNGAVVAFSGGLDSAVTLVSTVKAIGSENVTVLTMPECDITPKQDLEDVTKLCDSFDVTCETIEITPILHVMYKSTSISKIANQISNGNLKARVRMTILYYYANIKSSMVIGTSNKTELYLGYYTKYGDGAVDIMPLADLYKCQVRQLANHLKISDSIINKAPSARLWAGQETEKELGCPYDVLDLVVYSYLNGLKPDYIAAEIGIEQDLTMRLVKRIKSNLHKRRTPAILRLS